MKIHWDILDRKRKSILPLFKPFAEEGFYLAGGTGLALQIGHRDSIDFDFFKKDDYDTAFLINKLESVFIDHELSITQQDKNTVSCSVDNNIRLSFFSYNYALLKPLTGTDYFQLASIEDIACMKLSAIMSRAAEKDYVDLYFILQQISLDNLLDSCRKKYRSLDEMIILKSLLFFEDVQKEHILFKEGHKVSLKQIKKCFQESVRLRELKRARDSKEKGKDIER
jgi:hypothetical protein